MGVTSTVFLPFPITSFTFNNSSARSITSLLWGNLPSPQSKQVLILHMKRVKWLWHIQGMNVHHHSSAMQWPWNADRWQRTESVHLACRDSELRKGASAQGRACVRGCEVGFCEVLSGFRCGSNLIQTESWPSGHLTNRNCFRISIDTVYNRRIVYPIDYNPHCCLWPRPTWPQCGRCIVFHLVPPVVA